MSTPNPNRGGVALGEASERRGGVRALARRIARESQAGTISRHINGRPPTYEWRTLYQLRLQIEPKWFDEEPTKLQLRRMAK